MTIVLDKFVIVTYESKEALQFKHGGGNGSLKHGLNMFGSTFTPST